MTVCDACGNAAMLLSPGIPLSWSCWFEGQWLAHVVLCLDCAATLWAAKGSPSL